MEDRYKLVHSVDPSRCRAKIKDKFSKLALSSNKKKQENSELQQQLREQTPKANLSRNLLSELLTDDDSDEAEKPFVGNLIMRTDSSPSIEKPHPKALVLNETDATHCSQAEHDSEKSFQMDPLMVSALENTQPLCDLEDAIEKLSSRVSSLAVGNAPIRISTQDNPHDVSRIISTENQRMITKQKQPVAMSPKVKKEANVSICISSSSSDGASDTPITISDSSEGEDEDEHHVNVSSPVHETTSQTMVTVKADRMAAFLRDVRRNYGLPCNTPDRDFEQRQREIATADTEPMTAENDSRSAGTARRIATADTESMTESPEKSHQINNETHKRLALDDTEDMTKLDETTQSSRHYMPVMKVGSDLLDESVIRAPDSVPDDSLTIAETSDEENEESNPEPQQQQPENENALKPSESVSQMESKDSSVSSTHSTQVHINISAKINIKIQVSQQMEDSSSSEFTQSSQSADKSSNSSSEAKPHNSAQKIAPNRSRALEDIPHSPPERDIPQKTPEAVKVSPDDFMDKAQRLLNELYGSQWKTPEVMRSLKKLPPKSTQRFADKETLFTVPESDLPPVPDSNLKLQKSPQEEKLSTLDSRKTLLENKDESVLDDFSIFRRNIPQDLDSTRLPLSPMTTFKKPNKATTASKAIRRPAAVHKESNVPNVEVTRTRSGRQVRNKYREIVKSDDESEGKNASGDSDASWGLSDNEDVENKKPAPTKRIQRRQNHKSTSKRDDDLVYLDLSKNEVEVQHDVSASPPANHDQKFSSRLDDILKSCEYKDKPKLECTPTSAKTKRKLFSVQLNGDDDNVMPPFDSPRERLLNIEKDDESVSISGARMPAKFEPFNKYLESVKTGKPIFKIQTPKSNRGEQNEQKTVEVIASPPRTPKSSTKELRVIGDLSATPKDKYGFLKSLDLCVGKSLCHPDALFYRDNFRLKKEELAGKLYEIYNKTCFDNRLDVPIKWNKKLTNTAGRCMNKKKLGERTCVIELSEKVLTSADRLRCTLIHELCHAVTWVLHGEGGHGATWKSWARKANQIFPELPKIGVCHQYDIEYKYTYKCTLCGAKSHAHSKSKKVENIRCSYCHGAIEIYLNKKDKEGKTVSTPVKEPTGFAKFVKDKYKDYKRPDLKHADVMKLLSNEFASLKVGGKP